MQNFIIFYKSFSLYKVKLNTKTIIKNKVFIILDYKYVLNSTLFD